MSSKTPDYRATAFVHTLTVVVQTVGLIIMTIEQDGTFLLAIFMPVYRWRRRRASPSNGQTGPPRRGRATVTYGCLDAED